ncbi:MAG: NAD(P)H-dependent glycerol-3-phosphate dehydrogenase, partial [Methylococcales bacterium]|nr:NAD(P)H-dependent glycerol-3-phosphate dehydrogenase [Methylococcales bacterium]
MDKQRICILGAGSWGTALAIQAARNNHNTIIWGHNADHMRALQYERTNSRYLPGITLPDNLTVTNTLKTAVQFSKIVLIAVPSHAFATTLTNIKADLNPNATIAWATKGLNHEDGSFLHQSVISQLGEKTPMAILSGPTFAMEVAQGLPSAISIASQQPHCATELADIFHSAHFRTYTSTDIIGTQIGG